MNGPIDIPDYFRLAADKSGFTREHYVEADLPTNLANITVMPFFGDARSLFMLSSLFLHRYLFESRADRYFVLCSHPGLSGLFPYVDEYWAISDASAAQEVLEKAEGFGNTSEKALTLRRGLREYFRDIITWEGDLAYLYQQGLTAAFFEKFKKVQVRLPALRSLKMDLNRIVGTVTGYKVFIQPLKIHKTWHETQYVSVRSDKEFWRQLFIRLLDNGITPIVWQTPLCHDLSSELSGKCRFFNDPNILDVMAVMRACHVVLDVYGDLNRYAAFARVPYVCVQERHKFASQKEYELDDLCVLNKLYRYIFSFLTILESDRWDSLLDNIVAKVSEVLPMVNRDEWPKASEMIFTVPHDIVRKRKTKRIGARFVKIPKI